MNKLKNYFEWFLRPTIKSDYSSNMDKVKKLKKKVKDLEFKVGGLENELMIIMKEHRSLINALDARIDILKEDCGECMKS
jgi:uncharacterized protein YPO0396